MSERLTFVNLQSEMSDKGQLLFDEQSYRPREKVVLRMNFSTLLSSPINGSCSVSVTDNRDVQPDSTVSILSSMLLTSELKGPIESPSWYFLYAPTLPLFDVCLLVTLLLLI